MDKDIRDWLTAGVVSEGESAIAARLLRLVPGEGSLIQVVLALIIRHTMEGHVCLPLAQLAVLLGWPDTKALRCRLQQSACIGPPESQRPLILDAADRLYLCRYWHYEQEVASSLIRRAQIAMAGVDKIKLADGLLRYFGNAAAAVDWQKVAAAQAVLRPLSIITGGPGTGKTTTVIRILALLLEQADPAHLHIALAAPTGKAAARMQEAILRARASLPATEAIRQRIPVEAVTVHRLLGSKPGSLHFRHNARNPLPHDVVIVDEASMLDLALIHKLLRALRPTARLILLGDKDQLVSVEAGAVLGELCRQVSYTSDFARELQQVTGVSLPLSVDEAFPLANCTVLLTQSHRFNERSGIGRLAQEINSGQVTAVWRTLQQGFADLRYFSPDPAGVHIQSVLEGYGPYLESIYQSAPHKEVLALFERFRILSGHRQGPLGVDDLNRRVEHILAQQGLIFPRSSPWYIGRPVMINHNDYTLRLYNGDIGITLPDPYENGRMQVAFPTQDGDLRYFSPNRLPSHDTVFAMTIHKSQGSEFDDVMIVLPERVTPVLNRNLLYTGLTRARRRVDLVAAEDVLTTTIQTGCPRYSGLLSALEQAAGGIAINPGQETR